MLRILAVFLSDGPPKCITYNLAFDMACLCRRRALQPLTCAAPAFTVLVDQDYREAVHVRY